MLNIFSAQYRFNQHVILAGISDLTQVESLWTPASGGNCLNFVAGHIVVSRANLLALLQFDSYWSKQKCLPYIRGAASLEAAAALDISEIVQATREIMPRLEAALAAADLSVLDTDGDPLWASVATFIAHEAYHAGQLHLLRRMLGRARSFG
jgi:uncharacterized damage-inducible protein DinB